MKLTIIGVLAVLVQHGDDRLGEHHQSNARRDGHEQGKPHAARQLAAEGHRVAGRSHAREQRQRYRAERHPEDAERQLHETKGHREPEGRSITELGGEY